jgi:hypothetical protein
MQLALRPYVTTGIVIVGASALVAAPLTISPSALNPPAVAIAPTASAVDQATNGFDTLFTNGGKSAEVLLNAFGEFPDGVSRAFLAAVDDPHVLPSLGSAFLYGFLNPAPGSHSVLADLAAQIPSSPETAVLLNAFRALGAVVAHSLSQLPSPGQGAIAMNAVHLPHVVDVVTNDLEIAGAKFGESAAFTAAFIGDLPGDFVDFVHAAAANPGNIPALLTNTSLREMTELGDAVFGPMVCLLRDTMPAPFGGPQGLIVKAVEQFLAVLPQPEETAELTNDSSETTALTNVGNQDVGGQDNQNVDSATGPLNFLNPVGRVDHDTPTLVKKDDVDLPARPRLNVVTLNPLAAASQDRATVGDNAAAGSAAPKPGQRLVHVVEKLAQAPAAIANSIHDALTPHKAEKSPTESPTQDGEG